VSDRVLRVREMGTRPHCWNRFAPADALVISVHPGLLGDPVLGPEEQLRFVPSRFTADGLGLDPNGGNCPDLACPHCHLEIVRSLLTSRPLFLSIVGAPASGKSCFLAAATWALR